jgi:hypothetical protein
LIFGVLDGGRSAPQISETAFGLHFRSSALFSADVMLMYSKNLGALRAKRTLIARLLAAAVCLTSGAGCVATRTSEPKRTAIEQLLLSQAADNALGEMDVTSLAGKKVYLEEKYFESEDKLYVLGSIRELITTGGGLLQDAAATADIIVEARSGALSIDSGNTLVGLPEMPFPIPFAGSLVTPELPFYKADRQFSVAKIALLAYDAKSRAHVLSTGPSVGYSHHHYKRLLGFIKWTSTGLAEKRTAESRR